MNDQDNNNNNNPSLSQSAPEQPTINRQSMSTSLQGTDLPLSVPGPSSLNISQLQISPITSPAEQVGVDEDVNMELSTLREEELHARLLQKAGKGKQVETPYVPASFKPGPSVSHMPVTQGHVDVHQRLSQIKLELAQFRDTEYDRAMKGQPVLPDLMNAIADRESWIKTIEARLTSQQEPAKPPVSEDSGRSGEQSLILSDNCPRFGMPITGQTTKYKIVQKAHVFLSEFYLYHRNALGAPQFLLQCKRMLLLSILDKVKTTQISDALDIAIQKNESVLTDLSRKRTLWELCEACFIDKTTTAEERQVEIDNQIKSGRNKGETYEEYASRMQYIFRVYRVDNTSTSTLAQLRKTVSPWVRTSMDIFFCMDHPNDSNKHPNTLLDFCAYLTRIEGPDEKRELESDSSRNDQSNRPAKRQRVETTKSFKCQQCGENRTHNTEDCLKCRNCYKFGHSTKDCTSPKGEQNNFLKIANALTLINLEKIFSDELCPPSSIPLVQTTRAPLVHPVATSRVGPLPNQKQAFLAQHNAKNKEEIKKTFLKNKMTIADDIRLAQKSTNVNKVILQPLLYGNKAAVLPHLDPVTPVFVDRVMSNAGIKICWGTKPDSSHEKESGSKIQVEDLDSVEYTVNDVVVNCGPITNASVHVLKKTVWKPRMVDHDDRPTLQITIADEMHSALIDTGATHSFIDEDFVKRKNISIINTEGHIQLADKSVRPHIGETEHVEISYNNHMLSVPLEVMKQQHVLTIGMDLFHLIGLNITGLADVELSHHTEEPEEDVKPTMKPDMTPNEENTESFKKQKAKFMDLISPALAANENIPKQSFCPVPEMKVFLPVPEGTVVHRCSCEFAYTQRPIIEETFFKWLRDDVIELAPVGNVHNNTLTLAAKKDLEGKKTLWRVCLDPRPLNTHLPDDNFPVPLISDIMQQIAGHAIYSMIDHSQAYHRLPVHKEDQPLTAFMHGGKQYMFKKAPFGLKPLSSLFQRGMSRILGDLPFVSFFIDDLVIYSKNRKEHAEHVRSVIERLNEANLIINKEKCNFFATQIALLGFTIDLHGKRIDPRKLANIHEWYPPTSAKQVQSYMGTFNFFREHVPLISTLASPLDALRNAEGKFELNEKQMKAFTALKFLLVNAPILYFPNFGQPFHVATDASNVGIGAV